MTYTQAYKALIHLNFTPSEAREALNTASDTGTAIAELCTVTFTGDDGFQIFVKE